MTLSPMRCGRITGSRVAAVLGVSPYDTPDDVMRAMVRQYWGDEAEFEGNDATRWGVEHEQDGIDAYERQTGLLTHSGQEFATHPEHDWLGVTPDGLVGSGGLLEVKCPRWARYATADDVPHYVAQVQLQLAVCDRSWGDLAVWRPWSLAVSRIPRDHEWLDDHLAALEAFHAEYEATVASETLSAPHRASRDVVPDGWAEAAAEYLELLDDRDAVSTRLEAVRSELIRLAGGAPARGAGLQISSTRRKGTIDGRRVLAALVDARPDVDPETFRGAGSETWTVRRWAGDRASDS